MFDDKMGVSGWMFLLVPAYPRVVPDKRLLNCCVSECGADNAVDENSSAISLTLISGKGMQVL